MTARTLTTRTQYRQVWSGKLTKTRSGLTKKDLMKNKHGRIVSKKRHAHGKRVGEKNIRNNAFYGKVNE